MKSSLPIPCFTLLHNMEENLDIWGLKKKTKKQKVYAGDTAELNLRSILHDEQSKVLHLLSQYW